jgi:DNA primase
MTENMQADDVQNRQMFFVRCCLSIRTVVEQYGIEVRRNNTCLCPFHADHHPSAYIYPNAFHCFTCNVYYDSIGFVMELFGLSALEGIKEIE